MEIPDDENVDAKQKRQREYNREYRRAVIENELKGNFWMKEFYTRKQEDYYSNKFEERDKLGEWEREISLILKMFEDGQYASVYTLCTLLYKKFMSSSVIRMKPLCFIVDVLCLLERKFRVEQEEKLKAKKEMKKKKSLALLKKRIRVTEEEEQEEEEEEAIDSVQAIHKFLLETIHNVNMDSIEADVLESVVFKRMCGIAHQRNQLKSFLTDVTGVRMENASPSPSVFYNIALIGIKLNDLKNGIKYARLCFQLIPEYNRSTKDFDPTRFEFSSGWNDEFKDHNTFTIRNIIMLFRRLHEMDSELFENGEFYRYHEIYCSNNPNDPFILASFLEMVIKENEEDPLPNTWEYIMRVLDMDPLSTVCLLNLPKYVTKDGIYQCIDRITKAIQFQMDNEPLWEALFNIVQKNFIGIDELQSYLGVKWFEEYFSKSGIDSTTKYKRKIADNLLEPLHSTANSELRQLLERYLRLTNRKCICGRTLGLRCKNPKGQVCAKCCRNYDNYYCTATHMRHRPSTKKNRATIRKSMKSYSRGIPSVLTILNGKTQHRIQPIRWLNQGTRIRFEAINFSHFKRRIFNLHHLEKIFDE
eukprot:TRINITY_DN3662_c0_g1_i1.p1 TRINITY_DN3662_c0_g1~~TRINITY_DN3662_c0_g1_i1.p1  ORF type:complete len:588 (+),score=125.28 TRINITY_DN3662_c0_g1_i1:127-1890(+)